MGIWKKRSSHSSLLFLLVTSMLNFHLADKRLEKMLIMENHKLSKNKQRFELENEKIQSARNMYYQNSEMQNKLKM